MIIDQIFSFKQAQSIDQKSLKIEKKKCNYFVLNPEISISLKIIPLLAFRSDHWVNLANGCFSQIIDQKLSFATSLEKKYYSKDFLTKFDKSQKKPSAIVP